MVLGFPLKYTPSVSFSEYYDDNVFLVERDKSSDLVTVLAPQFRVSSTTREISSYMQYRAQVEQYSKSPDLNTTKHFADLDWTAQLTKSVGLNISDHFRFTPDSTEVSSVGVVVPRGEVYRNDSDIQLQIPRVHLSYQHSFQAFEEPSFVDSQSHNFGEQMALPLSPRYAVTQSYRMRYFTTEGNVDLQSHTAGAGLQYRFSPTFLFGASGGIVSSRTSSEDSFQYKPAVGIRIEKAFKRLKLNLLYLDDIEPQWRGALNYSLKRTLFRLNYSKELTAGGGVFGSAVNRQTASASLQRTVGRWTEITLTANYSTHKLISDVQDRFESYRGGVSLTYPLLRPWLNGGLHYSYIRQDSDNPVEQEFTRNQGTFSLTGIIP